MGASVGFQTGNTAQLAKTGKMAGAKAGAKSVAKKISGQQRVKDFNTGRSRGKQYFQDSREGTAAKTEFATIATAGPPQENKGKAAPEKRRILKTLARARGKAGGASAKRLASADEFIETPSAMETLLNGLDEQGAKEIMGRDDFGDLCQDITSELEGSIDLILTVIDDTIEEGERLEAEAQAEGTTLEKKDPATAKKLARARNLKPIFEKHKADIESEKAEAEGGDGSKMQDRVRDYLKRDILGEFHCKGTGARKKGATGNPLTFLKDRACFAKAVDEIIIDRDVPQQEPALETFGDDLSIPDNDGANPEADLKKMQAVVRGGLVRIKNKREQAATTIQKAFRRHNEKGTLPELRKKRDAATQIQAQARRKPKQDQFQKIKNSVIKLQAGVRGKQVRNENPLQELKDQRDAKTAKAKTELENKSANTINKAAKKFLKRRSDERREDAAIAIQKTFRHHNEKGTLPELRKKQDQDKNTAAKTINKAARNFLKKRAGERREDAGATINKAAKQFLKKRDGERRNEAATAIQKTFRRHKAKETVQGIRDQRDADAAKAQAEAEAKAQAEADAKTALQESSAPTIQKTVRGMLARRQLQNQIDAVKKIQARYRGNKTRTQLANNKKLKQAVTRVQANARRKPVQSEFQTLKKGIVRFQAQVRGKQVRQHMQNEAETKAKREGDSAKILQTAGRGMIARNRFKKLLAAKKQAKAKGATGMQSAARRMLERNNFLQKRDGVIQMQKVVRGFLGRQEANAKADEKQAKAVADALPKLQGLARQLKARQVIQGLRKEKDAKIAADAKELEALKESSAAPIQAGVRGLLDRIRAKKLRTETAAVRPLQQAVRKFQARNELNARRANAKQAQREQDSAAIIQKAARQRQADILGAKDRKAFQALKKAVVTAQRLRRQKVGDQEALDTARANKAAKDRELGAITIQQAVRKRLARNNVAERRENKRRDDASNTITGAIRQFKARKELNALRKADAEAKAEQEAQLQTTAAETIQRVFRGSQDRAAVGELREQKRLEAEAKAEQEAQLQQQTTAAKTIQRVFRGSQDRARVGEIRAEKEAQQLAKETAAATVIQKHVRAAKARDNINTLKEAALQATRVRLNGAKNSLNRAFGKFTEPNVSKLGMGKHVMKHNFGKIHAKKASGRSGEDIVSKVPIEHTGTIAILRDSRGLGAAPSPDTKVAHCLNQWREAGSSMAEATRHLNGQPSISKDLADTTSRWNGTATAMTGFLDKMSPEDIDLAMSGQLQDDGPKFMDKVNTNYRRMMHGRIGRGAEPRTLADQHVASALRSAPMPAFTLLSDIAQRHRAGENVESDLSKLSPQNKQAVLMLSKGLSSNDVPKTGNPREIAAQIAAKQQNTDCLHAAIVGTAINYTDKGGPGSVPFLAHVSEAGVATALDTLDACEKMRQAPDQDAMKAQLLPDLIADREKGDQVHFDALLHNSGLMGSKDDITRDVDAAIKQKRDALVPTLQAKRQEILRAPGGDRAGLEAEFETMLDDANIVQPGDRRTAKKLSFENLPANLISQVTKKSTPPSSGKARRRQRPSDTATMPRRTGAMRRHTPSPTMQKLTAENNAKAAAEAEEKARLAALAGEKSSRADAATVLKDMGSKLFKKRVTLHDRIRKLEHPGLNPGNLADTPENLIIKAEGKIKKLGLTDAQELAFQKLVLVLDLPETPLTENLASHGGLKRADAVLRSDDVRTVTTPTLPQLRSPSAATGKAPYKPTASEMRNAFGFLPDDNAGTTDFESRPGTAQDRRERTEPLSHRPSTAVVRNLGEPATVTAQDAKILAETRALLEENGEASLVSKKAKKKKKKKDKTVQQDPPQMRTLGAPADLANAARADGSSNGLGEIRGQAGQRRQKSGNGFKMRTIRTEDQQMREDPSVGRFKPGNVGEYYGHHANANGEGNTIAPLNVGPGKGRSKARRSKAKLEEVKGGLGNHHSAQNPRGSGITEIDGSVGLGHHPSAEGKPTRAAQPLRTVKGGLGNARDHVDRKSRKAAKRAQQRAMQEKAGLNGFTGEEELSARERARRDLRNSDRF